MISKSTYFQKHLHSIVQIMKSSITIAVLTAFLAAQSLADNFCSGRTNGYFADPINCIKYYHCFNGAVQEHITCPKEQGVQELYDPAHTWCNFPQTVTCGDRPICDENDENCGEATTKKPDDFECPADEGFFADPKNCIKYYHCYNGIPEEHKICPHDTLGKQELYDPTHEWCDHPERVNCGSRPICDESDENCNDPDDKTTTPSPDFNCPAASGYFPDPKNCIKYFHCFEGSVEAHLTCPVANGKQECYDEVNTWCDWPARVNCGSRPICDKHDENCIEGTTVPTVPTDPTATMGPTTTPKPDRCAAYGPCQMSPDTIGPYKAEGPCDQCFCQCVAAGYYDEVCCEPGLVFNEKISQCDWPFNIPECE